MLLLLEGTEKCEEQLLIARDVVYLYLLTGHKYYR